MGAGLVKRSDSVRVKLLAQGELPAGRALTVRVHAVSRAAGEKVQAAGGRVEVIPA